MSLTGNLEDLPLLDILQIVSFSKKTGHLTIRAASGDGAIVFRDGLVVCAFTWDTLPLDPRARLLPAASRDRMLRTRIELGLEQLIRLREGQFNFALSDELPANVESRPIADETLATGINPQELLLDLARGMDEDRRNSTALLEASFAEPPLEEPAADELTPDLELEPDDEEDEEPEELDLEPDEDEPGDAFIDFTAPASAEVSETRPIAAVRPAPAAPAVPAAPVAVPAPAAPAEPPAVLLVDDEEDVRRVVAEYLTKAGYQVVESDTVEGAVKKAHRLGKADIPFVLITDLGMPTSGGSSFQGGFEVVKRLAKMNLQPPVLMMTDTLSGAVQARARQLRIEHFVFKPGLSKLDPEQYDADLRVFANKLHQDILPRLLRPAEPKPAPPTPARSASAEPSPSPSVLSTEFLELQNRLRELRMRGEAGDIAGLVMKVAREFFERAVLFLVKDDEARGLAGFGAAPKADNLNLLARRIVIPLQEKSAFADVAASRKPFRGAATDDKGVQYLLGKVGRFKSGTVALLPLLTNRETIALLFGDNPESGAHLPRLEPLEVFINQAGIALENAFLQKKVLALQNQQLG